MLTLALLTLAASIPNPYKVLKVDRQASQQ
jgi:hypothetical protein